MELWAVSGAMLSSLGCLQLSTPGQAVRAMPPVSSSCSLPSSPNCLHTRVHFSFWLHDLKAAGGRLWALRVAKGHPGLGPSPQADVVMADCAMQALEEGARGWNAVRKRLQHSPGLAKDKGTSSQCFYCVLKRNHKPPKNYGQSPTASVLCSRCWVCRQRAWGLAAGTYSDLFRPWVRRMLHSSGQTNIFHFWNKDVYVLVLAG